MGTSTSNCPGNSRVLQAGIETMTTNINSKVKGFLSNFLELDGAGTWRADVWEGAAPRQIPPAGPPFIIWQNASKNSTEEVLNVNF
jgi:hypothetical protein